jgi:hypothetical protein
MSVENSRPTNRHWLVVFPLIGILIGVFAFTYSGRIESGDTLTLFNATASMVDFGDVLLDKTSADNPPYTTTPASIYPLSTAQVEPLQLVLTAPLYWLAERIPGIGMVHAVWFFNIFICTAIAVVIYFYSLTLGYRPVVGVTAALMLGFGTILWPYSKTFFREPLACLFILLTGLFMERWRASRYRSFRFMLASVISLVAAFLSKEAVIFALPALFVIIIPSHHLINRLLKIVLVLSVLFLVIFILSTILAPNIPFPILYEKLAAVLRRSPEQIETAHRAFHTYVLSIGGSVWGTSPVLLLAIPGTYTLYRKSDIRYPTAIVLILLGFTMGYAALRGDHWFGGLSWPSRFLVPILPYLMIGVLPVFDRVLRKPIRWWMTIGVTVVCLYSLWAQMSAVSYDWGTYINLLPPEAHGLVEWGGGLNVVRFLRWMLIPAEWGKRSLDFAWVRVDVAWWPIVCAVVVIISAVWLYRLLNQRVRAKLLTQRPFTFAMFPILLILLIGLGLRSINDDDLYSGSNATLRAALPVIQNNTKSGDVLLLADNEYEYFFLNHGKLTHPRVISLPDPPGEQPSPEQPPLIRSSNPDVLLLKPSVPLIYNLAQYRSTLWLLADFGPWHPWAVRPVERFLVMHYYPIREADPEPPDPRVRLIEYSTARAPDPFAFRGPDTLSDLRYGDDVRLNGFTLPSGNTYKAGDVVPISLYWQTDKQLEHDYTVAYFVADANGTVVAQGQDSQPSWGFAPTTGWKAGQPQWDNRALRLPADLAAGTYQLWIRLYQSDNDSIQLPVTGVGVKDNTIGVLPVQITVTN